MFQPTPFSYVQLAARPTPVSCVQSLASLTLALSVPVTELQILPDFVEQLPIPDPVQLKPLQHPDSV